MESPSDNSIEASLLHQAGCLRSVAHALVYDEHLAEDVAQTAFVSILEHDPADVRDLSAWMSGAVRNIASKLRRSRMRRERHEQAFAWSQNDALLSGAGDSHVQADALRSVTDAVVALDEPYRATVLARYFEDLTPTAIAKRDGVPVATVKSRLQRALRMLRQALDREHGDDRRAWCVPLAALCGQAEVPTIAGGGGLLGPGVMMKTKHYASLAVLLILSSSTAWLLGPWGATAAPESRVESRQVALHTPVYDRLAESKPESAPPVSRSGVATTGSVLGHVFWSTGEPAVGVGVKLIAWGARHPQLDAVRVRTDDDGSFLVDGLPPGKVYVLGDRSGSDGSGSEDVQLEAGRQVEVELRFDPGITVEGHVVDPDGTPVGGAEVWLSDYGNGMQGAATMHTDASGWYRLRDLTDQYSVSARHPDFGPSYSQRVSGAPDTTVAIDLVLASGGSALSLVVVDAEGRPVQGAVAKVVDYGDMNDAVDRRHMARRPIPYRLVTDEMGRIDAPCLKPGRIGVTVADRRHAPWLCFLKLRPGERAERRVVLTSGVTVRGRILDVAGEPLSGVTVRDRIGGIASRSVSTGSDGRYVLRRLAVGSVKTLAWARGIGKVQGEFQGVVGSTIEWNPVLDPGRVIRGRLVDEQGGPLHDWLINADAPEINRHTFRAQARTDADGRFQIVGCPDDELRLQAIDRQIAFTFVQGVWNGVVADGVLQEYRVLDCWRGTSYFVGRTVDDHHAPVSARLTLARSDRDDNYQLWSDAVTGQFRIGPLAPGHYSIGVRIGDDPDDGAIGLPLVELSAHETHPLGDIRLQGQGTVELDLGIPEGVTARNISVHFAEMIPGWRGSDVFVKGDRAEKVDLMPGLHHVVITGDVLREEFDLMVASDRTTRLECELRAGAVLIVCIGEQPNEPILLHYTLHDGAGALIVEGDTYAHESRVSMVVPPGVPLELAVETSDGRVGKVSISALRPIDATHPVPQHELRWQ